MKATPISWRELIVLMAFGDGRTDSIRGELHSRELWEYEGDDHAVHDGQHLISRRGDLVRLENLDGQPTHIRGAETIWIFENGNETPTAYAQGQAAAFSTTSDALVHRWPLDRWEGDDFTRVRGDIAATEFLGRPAWSFELDPPPHKPHPLQVVVDAVTGLVLRQANRDFGSFEEWTSLEVDADLPDELFAWSGPTRPPVDHYAEHERDMLLRQQWLAEQGIANIRLEAPLQLMPHEWDDSGAFYASVERRTGPEVLARRPASDEPWLVVDDSHFEASYRFVEGDWEWYIGAMNPLPDDVLDDLRARLRRL